MTTYKAQYDKISTEWNTIRQTLSAPELRLFAEFQRRIEPQSHLLDLGCGSGCPVATMLTDKGFEITGVDRSHNLLEIARTNMPNQHWVKAELEEYRPTQPYTGIILWDCLLHLPIHAQSKLISKVANYLLPNGVLILSSGGSEYQTPAFHSTMFNVDFYCDSMSVPQLIAVCRESGLELIKKGTLNQGDGTRNPGRMGFVMQKRKQT
ncbi:class I SAM-dependent methyltransferase [Vibrio sonorensis]|uniref:class I SAM-dependent methyltransferase n=1 Tax=Vibrio sonorensis TaxID=1004316 RepID=UPI0008DA9644|nr:class I SAM-dependent methyltransferase [Vibrio sonorensis]